MIDQQELLDKMRSQLATIDQGVVQASAISSIHLNKAIWALIDGGATEAGAIRALMTGLQTQLLLGVLPTEAYIAAVRLELPDLDLEGEVVEQPDHEESMS